MNKNFALATLTLAAGIFSSGQAWCAVTAAELAELQFHKVNQLVATKKIDAGFVDHLQKVQLQQDASGGNFTVSFFQEADAGQPASAVLVKADPNGRPLSFTSSAGRATTQPANWGGKAPLDLLEKAIEYVSDTVSNPILAPFRANFTVATISPFDGGNGLEGKVEVAAAAQDGMLEILVDLNGNILSAIKK